MCKKTAYVFVCLAMLVASSSAFAAIYPGRLGVNLGGAGDCGGIFVDMAKEQWRYSDGTTYDSQGWPTRDTQLVMDFRLVQEWVGDIDDPCEYRYDNRGTYKCSFVGQATLAAAGATITNKVYNAGTNTTTFDLNITQKRVYTHISFTSTRRVNGGATNTGFTNLKMIKPGYPADTTQIFTTNFINTLTSAGFGAMRFGGLLAIDGVDPNYPATTVWANRKLTTDASQVPMTAIGKPIGIAWEYVYELANSSGVNPWINIPVSADNDYVTQLATMLRDNLDPDLVVYVESSNEVWNGAYPYSVQRDWNVAQAAARGITGTNAEHLNHARRAYELAQIFQTVFGPGSLNNRVRVMLCSHSPMLRWWVDNYGNTSTMLGYLNATFGAPKNYIYAIACQTYFGGSGATGGAGTDTWTITQILDQCHSNITAQINDGTSGQSGRMQWVAKAAQWQLPGGFCSYEGGPDFLLTDWDNPTRNIDNRIMAHRVARMGDELKYNYDNAFFALGANLACHNGLFSAYTRYGSWGLTDDLANPDRNYKFQAVRDMMGNVTGDFNVDSNVDLLDLAIFADQWLTPGDCPGPHCADFKDDNEVDFYDFALFGHNWGL